MQFTPVQIGEHLGVKVSMVRRYLIAWESIIGEELPRDPKTNARLVTDDVLAVLERARAVVKENPAVGVEDALRAVLGVTTVHAAPVIPNAVVTSELLDLMRGLGEEVRTLREEIKGMRLENQELRKALTAPPEQPPATEPPARPWWKLWTRG